MRGKQKAQKAKRLKRTPVDCDDFWGWRCADVATSVDWEKLQQGLDSLMSPRLWANQLTLRKVAGAVPLQLRDLGSASGSARKQSIWEASKLPAGKASEASASTPPPSFLVSSSIAMQASTGKGRGWYATEPLDTGVMVLIERPLVAVLDGEWRDESWAECGSSDSAALSVELARCYSSSLASLLSGFHPQEAVQANDADSDEEEEPILRDAMRTALNTAWKPVDISEGARERLEDVVRLNSLGFYTNSEQLCHHENFAALTGNGLFALASGFNHSCEPSLQRCSFGDLTAFVTNQPVAAGSELCISYIESELLCAPKSLRSQSLNRDFVCACTRCHKQEGAPEEAAVERNFMRVDAQVQANLALLPPKERVRAVAAALEGHLDEAEEPEEEEEEAVEEVEVASAHSREKDVSEHEAKAPKVVLLGKDAQELRVVQAQAFMQMQEWESAFQVWRQNAAFSCHHCPPFDEALVVYAMQAALCKAESSNLAGADNIDYVRLAVEAHCRAFGVNNFAWRYAKEVEESRVSSETKNLFWSAARREAPRIRPFAEAVRDWCFKPDEVPPAFQSFTS
ncbi:hypothetical protein AK812_SmicGene15684 [Symbiodinium microadriaticum]|uniref:SET domain-containing protein n=1 Tax=Symbiodinium microadriaticum TaxID=2951 RepID=A0A1Q9E288_SYMMI|nr:hypothetical protein AK812_SmicGene15684 [Symbiodinium microadriaticum]